MAAVIALLGAPCTGKTQLSLALAQHLREQGIACNVVPETLRQWCDAHQRTPRPHEQLSIAHTQTQAIAAASAHAQVVIADTSALQTAVYSELYFGDTSLYDYALAQQHPYSATLLMGLDLPWEPGDWQRGSPQEREQTDALLRQALLKAELPFATVYGQGQERLNAALIGTQNAINSIANYAMNTPVESQFGIKNDPQKPKTPWVWACDKCSDPDCEHKLLTRLQAGV
jgi:nicotinamide riboside kinase